MRTIVNSLVGIAAALLLSISFGGVGFAQTQKLNCDGVDSECLISEVPAPGVRIVRQQDYPKRPAHYLSANLYTTLAADRETDRKFCSFDFVVNPRGGPLPHTHRNEWETFYVEQGTVLFTIGVSETPPFHFVTQEIPAGTIVFGPQGPVHGFVEAKGQSARIFSFVEPCGLDSFFHNAGTEVKNWFAPIPPITFEEIVRTAFWAQQRGDALYPPGFPGPVVPVGTPEHQIRSIFTTDPSRRKTGPFGETRVVLLKEEEVGHVTGQFAFCGPGIPVENAGGSVEYSYFSMAPSKNAPAPYISTKSEVFYTQTGRFTMTFANKNDHGAEKKVTIDPLTFVQIDPGVAFSIFNDLEGDGQNAKKNEPASTLAITVIPPANCPPPFMP